MYVTSLKEFILETLERYKSENKLIWPSYIPENKIWIKIGGDKGGGSFKACIQIVNVEKPNGPNNTTVFAVMEAPDYYENLDVLLQRYEHEIPLINGVHGMDMKLNCWGEVTFST